MVDRGGVRVVAVQFLAMLAIMLALLCVPALRGTLAEFWAVAALLAAVFVVGAAIDLLVLTVRVARVGGAAADRATGCRSAADAAAPGPARTGSPPARRLTSAPGS